MTEKELPQNEIIQGDCLEVMQDFPDESIDLVLTDSPYGINYQSAWQTKEERFDKIKGDKDLSLDWIEEVYKIVKDSGAFLCFHRWDVQSKFKNKIEDVGFNIKSQVIWDRGIHGLGDLDSQFAPQHDNMWFAIKDDFEFNFQRPQSVISIDRISPNDLKHPTQKPVELIKYLIKCLSNENDLVLDPFLGSGTTAVACKQTGRDYIGIELSEEYCEIARDRLKQEQLEDWVDTK